MSKGSRIFIISELYYPEQTSTGYLVTCIAERLAKYFPVNVIAGPATNFLSKIRGNVPKSRNGVRIFRGISTTFNKNNLWGRLINIVISTISIMWVVLFKCARRDQCLVVTNPPLLPFAVLFVSYVKGFKLVLLIHDVYPEILVASGMKEENSLLFKLGQKANRFLYQRTNAIVTLGRDMTQLVRDKLDTVDTAIYMIPNWADCENITPESKKDNRLLKKLGLNNKFVLLYAGNMGRTHGIEDLAQAANEYKTNDQIHFLFLGFGAKKQWLQDYKEEKYLNNVTLLPPKERSEQPVFLNACDVAIISFNSGMAGVSVPSRMYNHMAAGRPIIAITDDHSELALTVKEEEIGWVVEPNNNEQLLSAIKDAFNHPEKTKKMGDRAAEIVCSRFSFDKAIESYRNLFMQLRNET